MCSQIEEWHERTVAFQDKLEIRLKEPIKWPSKISVNRQHFAPGSTHVHNRTTTTSDGRSLRAGEDYICSPTGQLVLKLANLKSGSYVYGSRSLEKEEATNTRLNDVYNVLDRHVPKD